MTVRKGRVPQVTLHKMKDGVCSVCGRGNDGASCPGYKTAGEYVKWRAAKTRAQIGKKVKK